MATLALFCCPTRSLSAIGTWKAFMAYYDVQQIVKAGSEDIFVRASNNLYSYNTSDESITTYDHATQLSDTYIDLIGWSTSTGKLLIFYSNSNIDLLDLSGNVTNISDLYSKSMTEDKSANSIYMYGDYAYVAANFGVMKINMDKAEISETYFINGNEISNVAISGSTIYAKQTDGKVLSASTTSNLIDKSNWTTTTDYDADIFTEDTSDYDTYYPVVSTLNPGGPKNNCFGFMRVKHGNLYTVGGGYNVTLNLNREGTVQVLEDVATNDYDWTIYNDTFQTFTYYKAVTCVDADPFDESRVFACGRTGLYEFHDGDIYYAYDYENSPIKAISNNKAYQCIYSCVFDDNGNLWLLNSNAEDESLFKLDQSGNWTSLHKTELTDDGTTSKEFLTELLVDSRGYIWFIFYYWENAAVYCYVPSTDELRVYDNFINQDNTDIEMAGPTCISEDNDGNIWVGTDAGPLYIDAQFIDYYSDDYYFTQVKVPRNDGTNYADYLLSGVSITDIAVDAANRKWFGTEDDGVYLISEDNIEEEEHFTFDNSYLLSDEIESIAIYDETGEVFFGTSKGLCSYMGDATTVYEEMDDDNVYAYPNPVEPGYTGLITVVGLSLNADVKIVSANGALVAEGKSNGGSFTWDGNNKDGKRVASGVYMVMTAKSDGSKGTVCKIAIVN